MKRVNKYIKGIRDWVLRKFRAFVLSLMLAMSNIEVEMFKFVGAKTPTGGIITKFLIRSRLLENFFLGRYDEKYVQKFYEILKKADVFMRNSTPHKIAVSADTYAKTLGKTKYGRNFDHFGFFDEKHKHHGKTVAEVIELELEERRTKDDDYKIIQIINNKPIDVGLSKIDGFIREEKGEDGKVKYISIDTIEKSKKHTFPINIVREGDRCVNKIEQLSEFLHIKKIGFDHRRFEFFIPLKYKTTNYGDEDGVIKDILNIKEIYAKNDYGELTGFAVNKFISRFEHGEYEVFRFDGIEMEKINNN